MMSYFKPFALAAISILFVGCAQKTIPDPEPSDTTYGDEASATTDSMGDDALIDNPNVNASIEGHADERGSREYNIGLGERRAQAVRQMLMIQGVSASQISTVSFGEERPVAFGSSEGDYAQNRRVEFTYTN